MVLWLIRGAGFFWPLAPGETASPGVLFQICIASTGLFSPLAGALYSLCWQFYKLRSIFGPPLPIFIGEGIGAALGAPAFYLVFIGRFPTLTSVCLISLGMVIIAAALIPPWQIQQPGKAVRIVWCFSAAFLLGAIGFSSELEQESRKLQWGDLVVAVRDTPYHNLALIKKIKSES